MSKDDIEQIETSHWLTWEQPQDDELSSAERMNIFQLALWLAGPTRTRICYRFEENKEEHSHSVVRVLDRFHHVESNSQCITRETLEEAESYFEPIIKIRRDKKRLIHALDLTLQGCFAQKWNVRFVCFGSAAEVILNYGEKDELTEALANAYAVLVPGDNSKKEFKRLYGVRSNIVHGNVKKLKDAEANIQNLSAFEDMIRVLWKTILCDNGLMDMLEKSDKERETWFGTTRGETMTLHPQFVVDAKGKKKSVLLSYKEYEELLELAQDSIDAKMIEEAKDEPRVPWEQVKSKVQASRL